MEEDNKMEPANPVVHGKWPS